MPKITSRNTTFLNSATPLTSERVRIILGHPKDAEKLADAIRKNRRGENSSFTLSQETKDRLKEAEDYADRC